MNKLCKLGEIYKPVWRSGKKIRLLEDKLWIPVDEKLPERYRWVLAMCKQVKFPIQVFYDGRTFKDAFLCEYYVTHWCR